jgi:hypothetical protein
MNNVSSWSVVKEGDMETQQLQKLEDLAFRPLLDTNIIVGGTGTGCEGTEEPIWLNFPGATPIGVDDQPCGEPVRLAIALTPAQYAQVVKLFFRDVTVSNPLMAKFLRRLLQKRWAMMTRELARDSRWLETYLPRYDAL